MASHQIKMWRGDNKLEVREFSHLSDAVAAYMRLAQERGKGENDIAVMVLVNGLTGKVLTSVPGDV